MMFKIVGMGPGHSDYVLPIAKRALDEADVIIGGKRHIEPFQKTDKELIHVEGQLSKLPEMIRGRQGQNIVVAVSGDTGFYSLLSYMKKKFRRGRNGCHSGHQLAPIYVWSNWSGVSKQFYWQCPWTRS